MLPSSNTTPAEYERMVRAAKDYIAAGDIFQVVLSQRFEAPFELPPFALYRALRRVNPSPYLYFLDFGDFARRRIEPGNPGQGARRHRDHPPDRRHPPARRDARTTTRRSKIELLADPKERAEHLMLLDLGRNDVGRVAEIGTVKVTDQFFVERYSQVMHIVSNVEGTLADPHDALDALAAGFPAGTVSGAPKVRAMEIIDELEKEKRGALCRLRRLFLRRRRDGHLHRAAHRAGQGRRHVRAGRRRHRRRFRSRNRAAGMRQQGQGAVPRRRGGQRASPARPDAGSDEEFEAAMHV